MKKISDILGALNLLELCRCIHCIYRGGAWLAKKTGRSEPYWSNVLKDGGQWPGRNLPEFGEMLGRDYRYLAIAIWIRRIVK